jgi:hypothetical protein
MDISIYLGQVLDPRAMIRFWLKVPRSSKVYKCTHNMHFYMCVFIRETEWKLSFRSYFCLGVIYNLFTCHSTLLKQAIFFHPLLSNVYVFSWYDKLHAPSSKYNDITYVPVHSEGHSYWDCLWTEKSFTFVEKGIFVNYYYCLVYLDLTTVIHFKLNYFVLYQK